MKGIEGGLLNLSINLREKRILFKSLFLKQKVEVNLESFQAAGCLYLSNFTLAVVHSSSALVHSHTKKRVFQAQLRVRGPRLLLHRSATVRAPYGTTRRLARPGNGEVEPAIKQNAGVQTRHARCRVLLLSYY